MSSTDSPDPSVVIPAAGTDPDSIEATAKVQLAAADPTHDERARDDLSRARKARALVDERNAAAPDRVVAIDKELAGLGFDAPLATTVAQRGETRAPLGRTAPAAGEKAAPADAGKSGTAGKPAPQAPSK